MEAVSTETLGSIRMDAYENIPEKSTVCVYDPKTGRRGLSFPRMNELAAAAHRLFGYNPEYIIVIEVRPGQRLISCAVPGSAVSSRAMP